MKEFCGVADYDCLNPAGFGNSAGWAKNDDGSRISVICHRCGTPCCAKCREKQDGHWLCLYCAEHNY